MVDAIEAFPDSELAEEAEDWVAVESATAGIESSGSGRAFLEESSCDVDLCCGW